MALASVDEPPAARNEPKRGKRSRVGITAEPRGRGWHWRQFVHRTSPLNRAAKCGAPNRAGIGAHLLGTAAHTVREEYSRETRGRFGRCKTQNPRTILLRSGPTQESQAAAVDERGKTEGISADPTDHSGKEVEEQEDADSFRRVPMEIGRCSVCAELLTNGNGYADAARGKLLASKTRENNEAPPIVEMVHGSKQLIRQPWPIHTTQLTTSTNSTRTLGIQVAAGA